MNEAHRLHGRCALHNRMPLFRGGRFCSAIQRAASFPLREPAPWVAPEWAPSADHIAVVVGPSLTVLDVGGEDLIATCEARIGGVHFSFA